ncbi:uncharacterized protein F5147DRAFT_659245 [Suillus discolor]|uniref:Uncharacterized protein n=1 Tax=Suillus discolor TaxID=1912936 RepID=A0A9P7ESX0_9AGAM|nr:uncharacterized protein F5147DRAFT_659245 [Suillus discolor]KAG2086324.1 hypothetical protein F5147DRAFT_659245 [Suillus discolor]
MPKKVLLDRSTPAWPTQLGRYAQKVRQVPLLGPDFTVQGLQFDLLKDEVYGEWEEFVHPSGVAYYYNRTRNTYTGLNIRDCSQDRIDKFEAWIKVTRGRVQGDLILVAEPSFFPETSSWITSFYDNCALNLIGFTQGDNGENHQPISQSQQTISLASLVVSVSYQTLSLSNNTGHHQYLNYFGQPEARLLRTHSMGPGTKMRGPFPFMLTVAMLCLPVLVREHLKQIYVDGLVNYLDLKNFIDDFNTQNNAQITLAGVIMAIDTGFLAVQGVGTGLIAESILKGSIIFCAYYLDQGMTVVIGVLSAPRFFCMMRQVNFWEKSITWSGFGFLASAFIDAQHSKPAFITCACCLAVVTTILSPLAWYGLHAGVTPYVHLEDD